MGISDRITEIGLRRTECYGTCPVYKVVIQNDGSFIYHGKKFVRRLGEHQGQVCFPHLEKLMEFIIESGFMALENCYSNDWTDQASVFTSVVLDGVKKEIEDYGCSGPVNLWVIEELIDKLLIDAEWY